jgi:CO/xanthine dehydrogenase Mo-binding subunit
MGYGSYVAACAEVSVDKGAVKIHRIVAATDPGHAVNPAQIERQIAGSFVYGLSALFYQECTVKEAGPAELPPVTHLAHYRVAAMAALPTALPIAMRWFHPIGSKAGAPPGERATRRYAEAPAAALLIASALVNGLH